MEQHLGSLVTAILRDKEFKKRVDKAKEQNKDSYTFFHTYRKKEQINEDYKNNEDLMLASAILSKYNKSKVKIKPVFEHDNFIVGFFQENDDCFFVTKKDTTLICNFKVSEMETAVECFTFIKGVLHGIVDSMPKKPKPTPTIPVDVAIEQTTKEEKERLEEKLTSKEKEQLDKIKEIKEKEELKTKSTSIEPQRTDVGTSTEDEIKTEDTLEKPKEDVASKEITSPKEEKLSEIVAKPVDVSNTISIDL